MSQKNVFFEGSAHVPLLIVPPAGRFANTNRKVDTLVEIADIYPTILEMAGVRPPEFVQGRSLLGEVEDRVFFGNSLNKHFCVMEDRLKLVYCASGGHTLLFDLANDPMERHDLSHDPAYAEKKERLWKLLVEHTRQYTPQVLDGDEFITQKAITNDSDVKNHWFGFHYHDYTVDTFH